MYVPDEDALDNRQLLRESLLSEEKNKVHMKEQHKSSSVIDFLDLRSNVNEEPLQTI